MEVSALRGNHEQDTKPSVDAEHHNKSRSRAHSLKRAISLFSETSSRISNQSNNFSPDSPHQNLQTRKSFTTKHSMDQMRAGHSRRASQRASVETLSNRRSQPSQYYQDPEARMKLKLYLSTPQKFEEALQFGFPTANAQNPASPPGNSHDPHMSGLSSRDLHRFMSGNTLSFIDTVDDDDGVDGPVWDTGRLAAIRVGEDKDGDDNLSIPDVESPLTPADSTYQPHYYRQPFQSHIHQTSYTSYSSSKNYTYTPMSYEHQRHRSNGPIWDGDREMTLRMTLTKPELRSPDSLYEYGHHALDPNDPLALEPLSAVEGRYFLEDPPEMQEGCKVKSWWRRVKNASISRT